MIVAATTPPSPPQRADYLPVGADQLYYVLHAPPAPPRAVVLLCGPIGGARERAYRTFVEIAQALAAEGFAAMHFDFRGIGESGPGFERFTMSDWRADIEHCTEHLRQLGAGAPVLLVGLRASAILASEVFRGGVGDAALLASPVATGQGLLQDVLRRHLMADMLAHPNAVRVPRDEIIAAILRGETYNIDGYFWTKGLWQDAASHSFVVPDAAERRPWWIADFTGLPKTALLPDLESHRVQLQSDRFWEASSHLVPRGTAFRELVLRCALETASRGQNA